MVEEDAVQELRFEGRVALVTGVSTRGLGLDYARALASLGCQVMVNDYGVDWAGNPSGADTDAVVEILRGEGWDVRGVTGNVVTDADQIVAATIEAFGRLDAVINNAGAGGDFDTLVDVHLRGSNRITQAAWEHLVASGNGRIVNIASSGTYGSPAMPGYSAAKGGIIALTRTQGILGAPHGVRANVVLPSAWTRSTAGIDTAGWAEFMAEFFPPEEVAPFVAYLAHADAEISGEAFAVGGGLVTRIVQAETTGVSARGSSVTDWAQAIGRVMDPANLTIPSSMWDHLDGFTGKLSPEAQQTYRALGIDPAVPSRLTSS